MHVNGTAIPSTYVNFTIVELNTVSLQVNVCAQGPIGQIWHLCQGPLEIGVTAAFQFIHLPRPSSRSQWSLQERIGLPGDKRPPCMSWCGNMIDPAIHSPRRNHTFVGSNQVLQA